VVLFYSPTRNFSKWAKLLADGKFEDLEVSGLPSEKRLREPLLRLIEVYEDSKKNKESEKLSSSIQRSFDCDDWVHELATQKGETDVPPQIMIMKAPILDTHMQEYPHPDEDSNELIEDYSYRWSFKWYAKIDFTNTNPATQPISKDYRNGPDSDVFFSEFDGGYFEYMNDVEIKAANADITKAANHTIDALKARPKIGFQDEYDIENSDDLGKQDDKM
jgi:hypothetical protein